MKHFLISRNANGTISYLAQGSLKQMNHLCRFSIFAVTTIDDYHECERKFGLKNVLSVS